MREAEIAALTDEFFEPSFTEASATVMLGSVVQTDDYGDRTVTHLRPDARSLARVELHAVPAPEDDGTSVVERIVLFLRGSQRYSRGSLEAMFGQARKVAGPSDEGGLTSGELVFEIEHTMRGSLALRWWSNPEDPERMGEADGPDDLRVDEVHLLRSVLPEVEALDDDAIEEIDAGQIQPTVPPPQAAAATVEVDLDEAMDTGAWIGDLVWRMLRPDFTLERARELLGANPAGSESDGERAVIRPGDPRLELVMLRLEGERVIEVRIVASSRGPLILAIDAVSDRLNAQPMSQPGEITFQFESTRSRGTVALVLAQVNLPPGPIAAVNVIEVARGA